MKEKLERLCRIRARNHLERAKKSNGTAITSKDFTRGLYVGRAESYALIADLLHQPDFEKVLDAMIKSAEKMAPEEGFEPS